MRKIIILIFIIISAFCVYGCSKQLKQSDSKLTVCVASSLRDVVNEIQPLFWKNKGIKLVFAFSASGTAQKQIEEGAPVDVFISAGKKQMDVLEEKGLIDKYSRIDILNNKMVLIVPNEYIENINTIDDLKNENIKISIGDPETVPAGQYIKECLINLKMWDKLNDKIIYAKDVRQVVTYVEKGEVSAGAVYSSDVTNLKKSKVVHVFDENLHEPIIYSGAILSASKNKKEAKVFLDYLGKPYVKQIFERYGFKTIIK